MKEDIEMFLTKLRSTQKAIIVEGKKDCNALLLIGVRKPYILQGPLFAFVEKIADLHSDVIILTDLDREGRRLYSILARDLSERGVRIDTYFREFLFRNTQIRQIEGIAGIVPDSNT